MTPGPRFSATISASRIKRRAISLPSSVRRLMTVLRLLLLSSRKKKLSRFGLSAFHSRRARSPCGGRSILITSAPSQASIWVQDGPAWSWVKSMTRMPSSAWLIFSLLTARYRPAPRPRAGREGSRVLIIARRMIRGPCYRIPWPSGVSEVPREQRMEVVHAALVPRRVPAGPREARAHPALHAEDDVLVLHLDAVQVAAGTLPAQRRVGDQREVAHARPRRPERLHDVDRESPRVQVEHRGRAEPHPVRAHAPVMVAMSRRQRERRLARGDDTDLEHAPVRELRCVGVLVERLREAAVHERHVEALEVVV